MSSTTTITETDARENAISLIECNDKKMLQQEEQDDSSTDQEEDTSEIIHLEEDTESEYQRMDLKGESESDKDLIIYSLNESLQIHKEIVERIQNEQDELQDSFQQEKNEFQVEKIKIEAKKEQGEQQLNKLTNIYKSLLNELQLKKLEYRRMETRFYSQIKRSSGSEEEEEEEEGDLEYQINDMIQLVVNVCKEVTVNKQANILELWWPPNHTINHTINQYLLPLDNSMTTILTEKMIMDILLQDILSTSIHPGVSLNNSFGLIHNWVEKRNNSWANRMKEQIVSFIVKQSNEEEDKINQAKQFIVEKISTKLNQVYNNVDKQKIISIVNKAIKIDLAIKCQEQVEIHWSLPGNTFNENVMINVAGGSGSSVILVISPPFVATNQFIIPAKVYCV